MRRNIHSTVQLRKPSAILFDIDNTLYDYESANYAASQAVERKATSSLNVSVEVYRAALKQARQDTKAKLGNTASSHSRLLYFQRMIEILGLRPRLSVVLELEQLFWNTFIAESLLFPGVVDFLEILQRQNIPTAIITDLTAQVQLRKLIHFQLEDSFDAIVTSEEVGIDKPDVRNFSLALNKLQIKADDSQVWMIGDNPKADIAGGKTIGAVTFQKMNRTSKIGQGKEAPDYIFESFTTLDQGTLACLSQGTTCLHQESKVYQGSTDVFPERISASAHVLVPYV